MNLYDTFVNIIFLRTIIALCIYLCSIIGLLHDPCRVKKNTNNFFIGNFTILTQLCDFVVVF